MVMSVDLTVFLTVQAALGHLRERNEAGYHYFLYCRKGRQPGCRAYGAAKAGVIGLAKGLALVLPSEITVLYCAFDGNDGLAG